MRNYGYKKPAKKKKPVNNFKKPVKRKRRAY